MDLLDRWANWNPTSAPFIFDGDIEVLGAARSRSSTVVLPDWASAHRAPDFGAPNDSRLHLGLLPMPFMGDLRRAAIYVLLLNPSAGPNSYYGEHQVPEYRAALLANLKQQQQQPDGISPFLFLDPRFAWDGGFDWWHGKLAKVIAQLARSWDVSFAEARARLASQLACIELVPYHSPQFSDAGGWIDGLASVRLARSFVHEYVVPRARRGDALVIVTRQAAAWGLRESDRVVVYRGHEARAAHLSPGSRGGRAILQHLGAQSNQVSDPG